MKQRRSFAARLRHIAIAKVKLPDPKVTGDEAAHAKKRRPMWPDRRLRGRQHHTRNAVSLVIRAGAFERSGHDRQFKISTVSICLATVMDQFKMLTKMPEMAPSRVQGELYG